ncbi:MAG: hypothetical protein KGJ37_07220 [Verrucomicrobiota bacterium]|nr:hypothetical protein [Verrucomicrobiota bacterium]
MSLTLATLLPGLLLVALGAAFFAGTPAIAAAFKAMPRSHAATFLFFYGGTTWFLCHVLTLSQADFGQYRLLLFLGFTTVAVLAYYYVPDFLAVRGLCILTLLSAWPVLMAGYMNFDHPQVYFLKVFVYLCIVLALWLGAQPWRLRDFFQWLFATRRRAQTTGAALFGYGLLLCAVAFTY